MGSAEAATHGDHGQPDEPDRNDHLLTGLSVKFLRDGFVGLLELLKKVGGDGQVVDTSKSLDLPDLQILAALSIKICLERNTADVRYGRRRP